MTDEVLFKEILLVIFLPFESSCWILPNFCFFFKNTFYAISALENSYKTSSYWFVVELEKIKRKHNMLEALAL